MLEHGTAKIESRISLEYTDDWLSLLFFSVHILHKKLILLNIYVSKLDIEFSMCSLKLNTLKLEPKLKLTQLGLNKMSGNFRVIFANEQYSALSLSGLIQLTHDCLYS